MSINNVLYLQIYLSKSKFLFDFAGFPMVHIISPWISRSLPSYKTLFIKHILEIISIIPV